MKKPGQGLLFPFCMAPAVISLPMQETQEMQRVQSLGWEDTLVILLPIQAADEALPAPGLIEAVNEVEER